MELLIDDLEIGRRTKCLDQRHASLVLGAAFVLAIASVAASIASTPFLAPRDLGTGEDLRLLRLLLRVTRATISEQVVLRAPEVVEELDMHPDTFVEARGAGRVGDIDAEGGARNAA